MILVLDKSKKPKLDPKKRYLQIALNSTLDEAKKIINQLPISNRIIIEAGTPFIKRYGADGIKQIKSWYTNHVLQNVGLAKIVTNMREDPLANIKKINPLLYKILSTMVEKRKQWVQGEKGVEGIQRRNQPEKITHTKKTTIVTPYVVADMKMMDRGETEVEIARDGGADAVVALGTSPIESLDLFVSKCEELGLDSMIDMMNVEFPLHVVRKLKKPPHVVILHRGVDEEHFNKGKQLPLHEIRRLKSNFNIMIAVAGGDTIREVQRSIFNDADIVVVWKSFYQSAKDTGELARQFLKEIK